MEKAIADYTHYVSNGYIYEGVIFYTSHVDDETGREVCCSDYVKWVSKRELPHPVPSSEETTSKRNTHPSLWIKLKQKIQSIRLMG